jgi:hypothetical protein
MTQTINGTLYLHVNSNANLSPHALMRPGDVINVGASTNPFFRFYENHARTYQVTNSQTGEVFQVPAIKFLGLVRDGTVTTTALPEVAHDTAKHFLMLARELLWENVRLAEFQGAPSRQRCIWLVETLEDVKNWIAQMRFKPNHYSVIRVRAYGLALRVDSNNLAGDSEPLPIWFEKSRAYWSGKDSPHPLREVLFEGRIEVDEIIDPPNG